MKNQPAVQAFESTQLTPLQDDATPRTQYSGFMPPEGTVAIDAEPVRTRLEGETLINPLSEFDKAAHFANGKLMYETYCAVCHGVKGDGNGPVAPVFAVGGKGGVWPLVPIIRAFPDGHLYTTIRIGGPAAMPSYHRISSQDRWDIVNYIRHLDAKAQAEAQVQAQVQAHVQGGQP